MGGRSGVLVGEAKLAAKEWVQREGTSLPGMVGAFLAGSVTTMADAARLPASSDVDITVVVEKPPGRKLGKFRYRGVLLEVTYEAPDRFGSAETVLGDPHLAGGVQAMHIMADATGMLERLQKTVAREYACVRWVRQRLQTALATAETRLQPQGSAAPLHDRVTAWLFGTSMTALILLVAGLRAPTVRRRYVEVRKLLAEQGRKAYYEELLELLGCAEWTRRQAATHMDAVERAFDCAKSLPKGEYSFAADISDAGRPVAIEGSRALIGQGSHREAVFWMVATYSRCRWIFDYNGRGESEDRHWQDYLSMLNDLGVGSRADFESRRRQALAFLPGVMEMAEAVRVQETGERGEELDKRIDASFRFAER